ncbi:hypothetical protein SAMN05720468_11353 [Fibrobacter sp. UWEL]|nr:hypothetical protein SAMN05720468_11353 [Fibrobacter sp. UWEL]
MLNQNNPAEFSYLQHMPNENNKEELDLEAIINNMSSINSEDYWFTKVSNIEEHDESTTQPDNQSK